MPGNRFAHFTLSRKSVSETESYQSVMAAFTRHPSPQRESSSGPRSGPFGRAFQLEDRSEGVVGA